MARDPKKQRMPMASWLIALLAAASLTTGTVAAYLAVASNHIKNTFSAEDQVDPSVAETFSGTKKENVYVQVGDPGYAVYVRAAIVVTWKNSGDQVWSAAPQPGEYSLTIGEGWEKGTDGFYYHLAPVQSGGSTAVLIKECSPIDQAPESGYTLSVEIMTQTIQALGTKDDGEIPAVQDAWGVGVGGDGKLILPQ